MALERLYTFIALPSLRLLYLLDEIRLPRIRLDGNFRQEVGILSGGLFF